MSPHRAWYEGCLADCDLRGDSREDPSSGLDSRCLFKTRVILGGIVRLRIRTENAHQKLQKLNELLTSHMNIVDMAREQLPRSSSDESHHGLTAQ